MLMLLLSCIVSVIATVSVSVIVISIGIVVIDDWHVVIV